MKKAFFISGVFISTLIGAGFASGSEVLNYFSKYSICGLLGIVMCVAAFGFLQYLIVKNTRNNAQCSFYDYLVLITDNKQAFVISIFSCFFMLVVLGAMFSGFGQMMFDIFGIKKIYGVIAMAVITFIIVKNGYKTFIGIQSILSGIIVMCVIFALFYILINFEKEVNVFNLYDNFITSATSYMGYNMLTLCAVCCILGKNADLKDIKKSGIITFLLLLLMMVPMYYILCVYSGMIPLGELPLLTVCMRYGEYFKTFYFVVIFLSMLTTAVSNCYLVTDYIKKYVGGKLGIYAVMAGGFFISSLNFSYIVDTLYRVSGIISIYLVLCVLKYNVKSIKK